MTQAGETEAAAFETILAATESRVKNAQHAHWLATSTLEVLARWSTVANVLGGAIVSALSTVTLAVPKLTREHEVLVAVLLVCFGFIVSVISVLQSVMRWSERSQSHLLAANAYSSLRRDLEILRLGLPASATKLEEIIEDLRNLSETAPAVPQGLWRAALRQIHKPSV